MEVSVIGLGKLGLCTAACFAARGHRVFGMDNNQGVVEKLRAGQCPVDENGLAVLLKTSRNNLAVSGNTEEVVLNSEITLIIVPTPSNRGGDFSNEYVEGVLRDLAPALKRKETFHVVDVVSTVMPGSCDGVFKPLLEELTGLTCGVDFGLVYNPEFVALGSVIRDFLNPDMVLIGASDQRSCETAKRLYRSTCDSEPHIAETSLVNAEITKISLNCYVTMKISFANQLAAICEKVPGADIDTITSAMGADKRVGRAYLRAGLGFGGPCFPRDNLAFQHFATGVGHAASLGEQVVSINDSVVDRLVYFVKEKTPSGGKVFLLGMSYKPDTQIVEASQSVMIGERLAGAGYRCALYDPVALGEVERVLGERVQYVEDPYDGFADADAIVLLTELSETSRIDWERAAGLARDRALLVDCWRVLKRRNLAGFEYWGVGLGAEPGRSCH